MRFHRLTPLARKSLACLVAVELLLSGPGMAPLSVWAGPGDEKGLKVRSVAVTVPGQVSLKKQPGDGTFASANQLTTAANVPSSIVYAYFDPSGALKRVSPLPDPSMPAIELVSDGTGRLTPTTLADGRPSEFNNKTRKLFSQEPNGYEAALRVIKDLLESEGGSGGSGAEKNGSRIKPASAYDQLLAAAARKPVAVLSPTLAAKYGTNGLVRVTPEIKAKTPVDAAYIDDKLAQSHDLANPNDQSQKLTDLRDLLSQYESDLVQRQGKVSSVDDLSLRSASELALKEQLAKWGAGTSDPNKPRTPADQATIDAINALVTEVETLRAQASADMSERDAIKQLLDVAAASRANALRDRRDGKEMLDFHKQLSRLDTVMQIALSLNEINAAQKALKDMMGLLDDKIKRINASNQANQQGANTGSQGQANIQGWKDEAQATIDADMKTQKDLIDNEIKATMAVRSIGPFRIDMKALIDTINARDKGQSTDALKEYQRRIDLLPTVQQWRTAGNPNDPDAFSLTKFDEYLVQINNYITQANDGLTQLPTIPLEFAGAIIMLVPGPNVSPTPNTTAAIIQVLNNRKAHWQTERATFKKSYDNVAHMMDPNHAGYDVDEFGDSFPVSLPKRRAQNQDIISKSQTAVSKFTAQIDAAAAQINSVAGSALPMIAGLGLEQLREQLPTYGDKVRAVKLPDNETLEGHKASMGLLNIARLLPHTADSVIQWAKADATVKAIDDALLTTLPLAKEKLGAVVAMFDTVLADIDLDIAFVSNGGDNQALIDRKTALLRDTILPPLQGAKTLINDTLIPYQKDSIAQASPTGLMFTLFDSQKTLMTTVKDLYEKEVAWALASFGGRKDDPAGSSKLIADWRQSIQNHLTGYDDAEGHHKGVNEFAQEIANRKDPNYTGTEVLYGETQPYSLPRKISQYQAERATRATEINTQSAQINQIQAQIEQLSEGRYNLQSMRMPTGVTSDPAGVAKVQAVVDAGLITKLGDELTRIGNIENQGGTQINLGGGNSVGPPSGTQPPITLPTNSQIALLALECAKRLVPTQPQNPQSAAAAYSILRFLYSNSVATGAQDALATQVPVAEAFLALAQRTLNGAIAHTHKNDTYVNSGGTSETPEQLYLRLEGLFGDLASFLREGIAFFKLKLGWDQEAFGTVDSIATYYNGLYDVHTGGSSANASELNAAQQMKDTLQAKFDEFEKTRVKLANWMTQLNDPHESALRRVSMAISDIQEKTRAVLESNIKWHELNDQLARTNEIIKAKLTEVDNKQQELAAALEDPAKREVVLDGLPVDLVNRIEGLRMSRGAWSMGNGKNTSALVVKKSQYSAFLDTVLKALQTQTSTLNLEAVKADLLANPAGLSALIPGAQTMDFGNDADGFYLVYQSRFSVPNGLETESSVTLGNVAQLWGNNISVTGYTFGSPPNEVNAPYGDKGVEVQIESLQGKNWVNYLNIDFHRFAFDVPPDGSIASTTRQSRLMVFEDFAVMLFGDRLYIGVAGFGDFALDKPGEHPYYYGGNLKSSLKLTEVMKINFEQQELFARDPRTFLQTVNLDFTGYDPELNKDYNIVANGENKEYHRTQLGPSFDVGRLMQSQDAFVVDLFWAHTSGTDDINQHSGGVSILKGFTLRDSKGKPWMVINNKATGELGEKYHSFTDKLSFTLPNQGIVISGQAKILGTAQAYYGEIAKKMGDNSTISLGYGSPFVGMNNRLSIMMNTSFTLGQVWRAVVDGARKDLKGGEQLQSFNKELDDFFKTGNDGTPSKQVTELQKVFEQDVARKILTQEIGTLRKEIDELRKAGAFLDNTRTTAMVGFVTSPVSEDEAERATGGGFVAGTMTQLSLTKTQKDLIDAKAQTLFREGLRLQERMLELTKQWQSAVAEIAQAQWDLKIAHFMLQNAGSDALREQARVLEAEAKARLHQAVLTYNMLSGRSPTDPIPFDNLSAADLSTLMRAIRSTIATPDRLTDILHSLDKSEMQSVLGDNPFNIMDWIPLIDKFTVGIGVQLQDMMANQQFTLGMSIRLPIYDPNSKHADKAYRWEAGAQGQEMLQAQADRALRAQKELEQSRLAKIQADNSRPGLQGSATDLSMAIRAYRNGLMTPSQLQSAFDTWRWYAGTVLESDVKSALAEAWFSVDKEFMPVDNGDRSTVTLTDLGDAFAIVSKTNHSLHEVAMRQMAAHEMTKANDHRIQKAFLDVSIGWGLTATGIGWLPSIGITGIPVTPMLGFEFKPEELRELQVRQGKGQTEYYGKLKAKLEAGLALEFYQNIVAYKTAQGAIDLFDNSLIPTLKGEVDTLRGSGASSTAVMAAQRKLDDAQSRREQAELARRQSAATMNYLLGRPGDAYLSVDIDPAKALQTLQGILSKVDPVQNEQQLLDARVDVARSVETMVDKDLKVEQLALEPVSLVVRSLGRLIDALGSDSIGNPELVAAARIQTLMEERAAESFPKKIAAQKARAWTQLGLVRAELERLKDKTDPDSRLRHQLLSGRELDLIGALVSLGADPFKPQEERPHENVPTSFADLRDRVARAQQDLSAETSDAPVDLMPQPSQAHKAGGFARYYFAKQTLGKEPINRDYIESWIEVRLKLYETDPATLLKLSELRKQKADKLYKLQMAGARAEGDMLAADFETEVQMLRWALSATTTPGGPVKGSLDEFTRQLRQRLLARRDEIVALLNLAPTTTLEQLMALVPAEASGSGDLLTLSKSFVERIRQLNIKEIRNTLFDGGLPAGLSADEDLIHQLRADTIAERMSYKGFTPIAAFGVFRGKSIGALTLEAPDPEAIQKGLSNILADTLRKQLQATGELKQLTLALHSLMARVEDGAHELERRRELVEASESDYRAQMGRAQTPEQMFEVEAARRRLVDAWLGFSQQMVRTKSDFIALVTELEALGQGRETGLMPLRSGPRLDIVPLREDPTEALLSYWTNRMLDPQFVYALNAQMDLAGAKVPPALRTAIESALRYFQIADTDAKAVLLRDFDADQKLELLTRNDKEGKRQALAAELLHLLKFTGGLTDMQGPIMALLLADLDAQAKLNEGNRLEFEQVARSAREGSWKSMPVPADAGAAHDRLELLREKMTDARQKLLVSYLSRSEDGPASFVQTNLLLDHYLKAQQAYDDEVVKTFRLPSVKADRVLAWRLDGLFDLKKTIDRQMDAARSGRGLLALDAMIMLEESRLEALRWQGRAPHFIDKSADALQKLRQKREAWMKGSTELMPVYAVAPIEKDGIELASIEKWMTSAEFDALRLKGDIKQEADGRYYVGEGANRRELIGGVDAAAKRYQTSVQEMSVDDQALASAALMDTHDAVLAKPIKDHDGKDRSGYTVDELYAPGGLQSQGRLFYFERPLPGEGKGKLHRSLHPLQALKLSPTKYVVFTYEGGLALARDRYPTLESLASSPEATDFHEITLSKKGALALADRALSQRAAELRSGWMDVKLNSYGFARDETGSVSDLFLTEDDFQAIKKAFINAETDLAEAERQLKVTEEKAAAAKLKAEQAAENARVASLHFQVTQANVRKAKTEEVIKTLERQAGESETAWKTRAKAEVDRRVVQDDEYKKAQKVFEPVAKEASDLMDEARQLAAKVVNQKEVVKAAKLILARSKTWSLYISRDVTLSVDREGAIVAVAGTPAYGQAILQDKIEGGPAAFTITGEVIAAAMDKRGRIKQYYQDPKAVAEDAPTWKLRTVEMDPNAALTENNAGQTTVAPRYRLAHYELTAKDGQDYAVMLSRRYMINKAETAKTGLSHSDNYGIMPWNWGSLLLEIPRGVVGAPIELLTGRDPKQHHYLGRVYMYKTEGGTTENHGFFRQVANFIDVLNFLPDPVERFYDPSQFPDRVQIKSPVLPGQSVYDKDMKTVDGEKNVHYGAGSYANARRESLEDLTAARERTLSRFHGGVETTLIQTVRGRGRTDEDGNHVGTHYTSSQILAASGKTAIDKALMDPIVVSDPRSDGTGTVIASGEPGNIAVDRVEKRVYVRPGADQLQEQADALKNYPAELDKRLKSLNDHRQTLEQESQDAQADFDGAVKRRTDNHTKTSGASGVLPVSTDRKSIAPQQGSGMTNGSTTGSVSGTLPTDSPRKKIDEEWWARFLAGMGLLAILGGAYFVASERKQDPPPVDLTTPETAG